mgnify:CR=1 FL=1
MSGGRRSTVIPRNLPAVASNTTTARYFMATEWIGDSPEKEERDLHKNGWKGH